MKITKLSVYRVVLDEWAVQTRYTKMLKVPRALETTVLRIDTDDGVSKATEARR